MRIKSYIFSTRALAYNTTVTIAPGTVRMILPDSLDVVT